MERDGLIKALNIYNRLLKEGSINLKEDGLIRQDYEDDNIRELLNIIAMQSKTYLFENRSKIYLIPELENNIIGYTNETLKNGILGSWANNPDLFVCYYIAITIFAEFFSAQGGYLRRVTEYIKVMDMVNIINESLNEFINKEDIDVIEAENEFNIKAVAQVWNELSVKKDDGTRVEKQKSKLGYILRTCSFLNKFDILKLTNQNEEIRSTDKLEAIMRNYYAHPDREYKILNLLGGRQVGEN